MTTVRPWARNCAGEIERPRKLVRLHADQANHAGAGGMDAFGDAGDVNDGIAFVAGLDFDIDVGPERAVLRALHDQSVDARQAVRGDQRTQPLDDIAVPVVMRRLDQGDVKGALGWRLLRRGLARQIAVQRIPPEWNDDPSGLAAASGNSAASPAALQQLPWFQFLDGPPLGGGFAGQTATLGRFPLERGPEDARYLARSWRPSASFTKDKRSFSSVIPANALSNLAACGKEVISVSGSWPA